MSFLPDLTKTVNMYILTSTFTGHYVPQLAQKIHEYNNAYKNPVINLKGFMVRTK